MKYLQTYDIDQLPLCPEFPELKFSRCISEFTGQYIGEFRYRHWTKRFCLDQGFSDSELVREAESTLDYFVRNLKTGIGMIGEI